MIDKILERIEATSALSFAFGHTPVQMEYFQKILLIEKKLAGVFFMD